MSNPVYAACQNGVILHIYDSYEQARDRVNEEVRKDWLSIMLKRKLRKLLRNSGDVALHRYTVLTITEVKEIK